MAKRTNFVFILADDLGYADLGCYGGRLQCSPTIDRMATEGLLFKSAYASSSVCSPSRIAIATGRYQHRVHGGFDEPISGPGKPKGLPPEVPTCASLLRDAGYTTALVGKWHMGPLPDFGPLKSGYDEFFGHMAGASDYFKHGLAPGNHDLWEGEKEAPTAGYLTDLFTDRAVKFIRKHRSGNPFMLSLHYNAPHWPWETRDDEAEANRITNIAHLDGGSVRTYAKMIRQMDEGIAKVLAAIDEIGARDNTVIVFTSDNGGERFSDTYPLSGKKMDLLEGGIRVPCVVRWPARLPAGEHSGRLIVGMDWTPTFLAAAGAAANPNYPLDGRDIFGPDGERTVFWRMLYRNQKAARSGVWKYLSVDGNEFLYDLSRDERERANMRYREPERFNQLRAAYFEWDASMPAFPEDAHFDLVYTDQTMAKSSG
jgi:arylsulfatase A-like enzyme